MWSMGRPCTDAANRRRSQAEAILSLAPRGWLELTAETDNAAVNVPKTICPKMPFKECSCEDSSHVRQARRFQQC